MATTSDLEAGKTISGDNNIAHPPGCKAATEAKLLARKQGAKLALKQESSQSIAGFEESRLHADARVGVLLLLRYKYALDEVNTLYDRLVHDENHFLPVELAASPSPENYVKARETYEAHLSRYAPAYKSKADYERFLIATAANMTAHKRLLRKDADTMALFFNLGENKDLKPGNDLIADPSTKWTWGSDDYKLHHAQFEKEQAAWSAFFVRSAFALLGGFALIIPMLIMKLYPTTLNVCLTTTLFVIAASLLLGRFMEDTEPKDVLGITAAYAAVLVVFVGTSTTQSGVSNAKVAIIMGTVVTVLVLVIGISAVELVFRRFLSALFDSPPLRVVVKSSYNAPDVDLGSPSGLKPDTPTAAPSAAS